MGNILSLTPADQDGCKEDDEKWLKMSASELFGVETLSRELSKLPTFDLDSPLTTANNIKRTLEQNETSETSRSTADIQELAALFATKPPLSLNQDGVDLFHAHNSATEMFKAFINKSRSMSGLNGFVPGGPRAAKIFEVLRATLADSESHVEDEMQRRVRIRAALRLHLAIVRQHMAKTKANITEESTREKTQNVEVRHQKQVGENQAHPQLSEAYRAVFVPLVSATAARPTSHESVMSDLMFACGISVSAATIESLCSSDYYDGALRNAFLALMGVFSSTVKSLSPLDRRKTITGLVAAPPNDISKELLCMDVVTTWDRNLSDTSLRFYSSSETVSLSREGSEPNMAIAVNTDPSKPAVSFTVALLAGRHGSGSIRGFTFGIAQIATLNQIKSKGFGATMDSWGIQIASGDAAPAQLMSSGSNCGSMRALRSGDLLTIMFNRLKSYVELVLNLGEATHRFDVIVSSKTTIALNMPNNFVCGITTSDDCKFTILPYSLIDLEIFNSGSSASRSKFMANVVSNSLHNPVCAKQHTLKRQLGELPQIYVDSHGSGVNIQCNVCDRHNIQQNRTCFFHCSACSYDLCFICSLPPVPVFTKSESSGSSRDNHGSASNVIGILTSPLSNAFARNESIAALDRIVNMARRRIIGNYDSNDQILHSRTEDTYKDAFLESVNRFRRVKTSSPVRSSASEKVRNTRDIALSFMFAVSVLKEDLDPLLEVVMLLADEDIEVISNFNCKPSFLEEKASLDISLRNLQILPDVRDYVSRILGRDLTTLNISTRSEDLNVNSDSGSSTLNFFDTISDSNSNLSITRLFDANTWREDPLLTIGDRQALDIFHAISDISGGIRASFNIADDAYLDILVLLIERGTILLNQAASFILSGNHEAAEIMLGTRRARRAVYLCAASLKVVYFNLYRVYEAKRTEGFNIRYLLDVETASRTLIDHTALLPVFTVAPTKVKLPTRPTSVSQNSVAKTDVQTFRQRLIQILDHIIANPFIKPETSIIGSSAILYSNLFDILRPKASEQFSVICGLLEKSDAGIETHCEKALVISLMGGMEGPKLLELIAPSASAETDQERDVEVEEIDNFLSSLLLLADRSLTSKLCKTANDQDGSSNILPNSNDVGEGILKVLEPTTIQTFCKLCYNTGTITAEKENEAKHALQLSKVVDLVCLLIQSATMSIDKMMSLIEIADVQLELNSAVDDASNDNLYLLFYRLDELMQRSHVANLVPLVLFGTAILWKNLINEGQRLQAGALTELQEPLRILAASIEPLEKLEKRYSSMRKESTNYGCCQVGNNFAAKKAFSASTWDRKTSNASLEYTDNGLSCRRPGSASCYPAAFAAVPAPKSVFSVVLTETMSTTNWLTIGVCLDGFANSSSDGFGRSPNSWGIADDRSKETEFAYFSAHNQRLQAAPRKLMLNDVITMALDLVNGSLTITVNESEFSFTFGANSQSPAPKGQPTSYWYGATFANDHKLMIIAPPDENSMLVPNGTWVERLSRHTCDLQFLVMQQYLEHPVSGLKLTLSQPTLQSSDSSHISGPINSNSNLSPATIRDQEFGVAPIDAIANESTERSHIEDDDNNDEVDDDDEYDDNDEDDDDGINDEDIDNDDDNEDGNSQSSGSSSGQEEPSGVIFQTPALSRRRNGSTMPSILHALESRGLRSGEVPKFHVSNKSDESILLVAAIPEELHLVHNWCDSPLLMHGMFDPPAVPNKVDARSMEKDVLKSLSTDMNICMTSLSPLPASNPFFSLSPMSTTNTFFNASNDLPSLIVSQWAFLRQLTDAPNGMGASQRLVGIMKKYVREDQGSEAGPNHAVHATCAALIWHEGLAQEALEIVKASQAGADRRPSKALQLVWKKSQQMRTIFPEEIDEEDDPSSSLPQDQKTPTVAISMIRQFSLPAQPQTLKPATLAAVRRARLLLSYHPATVVTSLTSDTQILSTRTIDDSKRESKRDFYDFLQSEYLVDALLANKSRHLDHGKSAESKKSSKTLTIADCVLNFIRQGPDPDLVRKVAEERCKLAEFRARGISSAIDLLKSSRSLSKQTDVLIRVAESILRCSKSPKLAKATKSPISGVDSEKGIFDATSFRSEGCHYSSSLSGCTRHIKAQVENLWVTLATEVSQLGMSWLNQLDKTSTGLSASDTVEELESALLAALCVIGVDYRENDIDYFVSAGIYHFLVTSSNCCCGKVRSMSLDCLERLLHLCCRVQQEVTRTGHEALAYAFHSDSQRLPCTDKLLRLLLKFYAERTATTANICRSDVKQSMQLRKCGYPYLPLWLLQGHTMCASNEEGLVLRPSQFTFSPNDMDQIDVATDVFLSANHTITLWLYLEKGSTNGLLLSRLLGNQDPWSFITVRIVDMHLVVLAGNKSSIGNSTNLDNYVTTTNNNRRSGRYQQAASSSKDDEIYCGVNLSSFDGVHLVSASPLQKERWTHVGYTVDCKDKQICLYVNGALAAHTALTNSMCTSYFPFPELLPFTSGLPQVTVGQPFVLGQVPTALASIGRAAHCVIANVVLHCHPLILSEFVSLSVETCPSTNDWQSTIFKSENNVLEFKVVDCLVGASGIGVTRKQSCFKSVSKEGSDETFTVLAAVPNYEEDSIVRVLLTHPSKKSLSNAAVGVIIASDSTNLEYLHYQKLFGEGFTSLGVQNTETGNSANKCRSLTLVPNRQNVSVHVGLDSLPPLASDTIVSIRYRASNRSISINYCSVEDVPDAHFELTDLIDEKSESSITKRNLMYYAVKLPADAQATIISPDMCSPTEQAGIPNDTIHAVIPEEINQVVSIFDTTISDKLRLEFSGSDSTVYFPTQSLQPDGSDNSPPIAAVSLKSPRASFSVILSRNVMINDMLSIGLARVFNTFKLGQTQYINNQDRASTVTSFFGNKSGFGIADDSWGIYDLRKEESQDSAKFGACNNMSSIVPLRKLVEGDLISCTVDFLCSDPWIEFTLNGGEATHRYVGLPGHYSQYIFGIVMAMEHEFIIIADGSALVNLPPTAPKCDISVPTPPKNTTVCRLLLKNATKNESTQVGGWDPHQYVTRSNSNYVGTFTVAHGLATADICTKSDTLKLCSSMNRILKSLLSLSLSLNERKSEESIGLEQEFVSPLDGPFTQWLLDEAILDNICIIAFRAHSSVLRLVATKVLTHFFAVLPPSGVFKSLVRAGLLTEDSSFTLTLLRHLGCNLNPYATSSKSEVSILFPTSEEFVTTSSRQAKDLLDALTSSPVCLWWTDLIHFIDRLLPQLSPIVAALRESVDQRHADDVSEKKVALKWMGNLISTSSSELLGFLALAGGWLPSQALVPGSVVSHLGLGSSLPDRFVVVGYSSLSLFGEALVICPVNTGDQVNDNDSTDSAEAPTPFSDRLETVFTTYLQSEQTRSHISPALLFILQGNTRLCPLIHLLGEIICADTTDLRKSQIDVETEKLSAKPQIEERSLVMESPHPYRDNTDETYEITIPDATELIITFDPESKTEANYDYLRFFKDSTQTSFWGQEKYSGTSWPGVNGVDPLRIAASSCLLQFHTDGSNNDWGYRFTVVGILTIEIERPLGASFPSLSLLRVAKAMAIECALQVLLRSRQQPKIPTSLEPRKEETAFIYDFIKSTFPAALKTLLLHHVSSIAKQLRPGDDTKEVDVSLLPSVSSPYTARLLQTSRGVSFLHSSIGAKDLVEGIQSPIVSTQSVVTQSNVLFVNVVTALETSASLSPDSRIDGISVKSSEQQENENEDKLENFKGLSSTLSSALTSGGSGNIHSCPDQAEPSQFLKNQIFGRLADIDSPNNSTYSGSVQYRLRCAPSVTKCRIRASPSLDSEEVGDVASCAIIEVSGAIGGFFRLSDGRGFVMMHAEQAISWERVDSAVMTKRTAQLSVQFIDQLLLQDLDNLLGWYSYRFISALMETVDREDGRLFEGIQKSGILHFLLKTAGLGKMRLTKQNASRKQADVKSGGLKTSPLLAALRRSISMQATTTTTLPPLILSLVQLASGILCNKARLESLLSASPQDTSAIGPPLPRPVVLESAHEYENNTDQIQHVSLPGAPGIEITFDEECSTERNYDYVAIYSDRERKNMLAGKFSGRKTGSEKNWPGVGDRPSLIFEDRSDCWVSFITDGSNTDWGWRLTASPLIPSPGLDKSQSDLRIRHLNALSTEEAGTLTLGTVSVQIGDNLTKPSLGLSLALLDTLLDSSLTPQFLFGSQIGCNLLIHLSRCTGTVGESSPWLARIFFDVVTRITLLYRRFRHLPNDSDEIDSPQALFSKTCGIRETMVAMSKHVLTLVNSLTTSRRNAIAAASASKNPSPSVLYQAACQAAVTSAVSLCFDNSRSGPSIRSRSGTLDTAGVDNDSLSSTNQTIDIKVKEPVDDDRESFEIVSSSSDCSNDDSKDEETLSRISQLSVGPTFPLVSLPLLRATIEENIKSDDRFSPATIPSNRHFSFDHLPAQQPSKSTKLFSSQIDELKIAESTDSRDGDDVLCSRIDIASKASSAASYTEAQDSGTLIPPFEATPLNNQTVYSVADVLRPGYTFTHYAYVTKWSTYSGQSFAIGITLLREPKDITDKGTHDKASGNSLLWVCYPPSFHGWSRCGQFMWGRSSSSNEALDQLREVESVSDESDGKPIVAFNQDSSTYMTCIQSETSFREGDIVGITVNVAPSGLGLLHNAPATQVVFSRNGTDIGIFNVNQDDEGHVHFAPAWSGEMRNLCDAILKHSARLRSNSLNSYPPSPNTVKQKLNFGTDLFAGLHTSASGVEHVTSNVDKGRQILDLSERISDLNEKIKQTIEGSPTSFSPITPSPLGTLNLLSGSTAVHGRVSTPTISSTPPFSIQGFPPPGPLINAAAPSNINIITIAATAVTATEGKVGDESASAQEPVLFNAGSDFRTSPTKPRQKSIRNYFEPPSTHAETSTIQTQTENFDTVGVLDAPNSPGVPPIPPVFHSASSRRSLSSATRRVRSSAKSRKPPVARPSSFTEATPSPSLFPISVSVGQIHAELRAEIDDSASRRSSIFFPSPSGNTLVSGASHGSTISPSISPRAPGSSLAVAVCVPTGGQIQFLTNAQVPIFARRKSTVPIDVKGRDAVQQSIVASEAVKASMLDGSSTPKPRGPYAFKGTVLNRWDQSISDDNLVYSANETVARRPGSASCYPASLIRIPSAISDSSGQQQNSFAMTVILQNAPRGPNSMSIGIARQGFKSHGSDGFGVSCGSWGLIESRSTGDGKIYAKAESVGSFRKMREGDIFSLVYDRRLGRCWLLIRHSSAPETELELCQEFNVHSPGENVDLVVGATYCNDHELRILDISPPKFTPSTEVPQLLLYEPSVGTKSAPLATTSVPPASGFVPALTWDQTLSDTALRFANSFRTVNRPGNVSCYPAALVPVLGPRMSLTAVLEECPCANNTVSFGIAVKGFPRSGQQAIGERLESWGIMNNRSEASLRDPSQIRANGASHSTFRRLVQGDILKISCEPAAGYAELTINVTELRVVFTIPTDKEYVLGATLCNNHTLTLLDSSGLFPKSHVGGDHKTIIDGTHSSFQISPFSVYLEQNALMHVLATAATKGSPSVLSVIEASSNALEKPTACETDTQNRNFPHVQLRERLQTIRRYNRESERAMKELRLSVHTEAKQIKMVNCSMQMQLLPTELHNLSSLNTILRLLQSEPYPGLTLTSKQGMNSAKTNNCGSGAQQPCVPNWRELIPGHVVYRQVVPYCMSWASECVQLPILDSTSSISRRVRVDGSVGYALQWTQPPHIPCTHVLRITALVYSYNPRQIRASLALRQQHIDRNSSAAVAGVDPEPGEPEKAYLHEHVICEIYGCGLDGPTVSDTGGHRQSVLNCVNILNTAGIHFFSQHNPSSTQPTCTGQAPFHIGDSVIRNREGGTSLNGLELGALGDIGDVFDVRGPFAWKSETDNIAETAVKTQLCIGVGTTYFEVHVQWRDTKHREIIISPEKSIEKSPPKIVLWRKNPMAQVAGSAQAALDSNGKPQYLWTPLLTRELEISLMPIYQAKPTQSIDIFRNENSCSANANTAQTFDNQDMKGYAALVITPVLTPTAVVHSAQYRPLVESIVNHFGMIEPATDISISLGRRDTVDDALVRLTERTLKQRSQNNERSVPDTWHKVAVPMDEAAHFPALTSILSKESDWRSGLQRTWLKGITSLDNPSSAGCGDTTVTITRSEVLAYRYTLLRVLNQELASCLDLINLSSVSAHLNTSKFMKGFSLQPIADLVSLCRNYIFTWVKESFIQKALSVSGESSSANKIEMIISRSRAAKFSALGEVDTSGRWTVFGQVFRRLHGMPASVLRRTGQIWDTVFAGERSHDSGGPYREAWSAMTADLLSNALPLLKPCPNNEGKVGMNQETFVINPDCVNSSTQMEMLVFLGKLMGSAARSNNYLDLYLTPIVWKLLVNQPVTFDDLRGMDTTAANQLMAYRQRKGITEQDFSSLDLHYCTTSKGGSLVELHPGGATEPVKWKDLDNYCNELEEYYLRREGRVVAEAVRAGLSTQLPGTVLSLLRWEELEEMVCGRPVIDVDLLQLVAEYERGCDSTDQHVQWLWELLKNDFSAEDRKAFVRFAWGRTRLPLTRTAFSQPLKLQGFSRSAAQGNADSYLPISHTCFFSVELPRYSSKEIMKEKLLYAIHNCTAIDGDDTTAGMRAAALGTEW